MTRGTARLLIAPCLVSLCEAEIKACQTPWVDLKTTREKWRYFHGFKHGRIELFGSEMTTKMAEKSPYSTVGSTLILWARQGFRRSLLEAHSDSTAESLPRTDHLAKGSEAE